MGKRQKPTAKAIYHVSFSRKLSLRECIRSLSAIMHFIHDFDILSLAVNLILFIY